MQRSIRISLKELPGVSRLLASRPLDALTRRFGRQLVTDLLRETLEALRGEVLAGRLEGAELRRAVAPRAIAATVTLKADELLAPRPRPVINATGVIVHTNLGRSLLSEAAARQVAQVAGGYVDLEYDVAAGRRGSRLSQLEPLMGRLFPGYDFVIVNNNAAAIMLCLHALSRGKEVLVSRGEVVEIGGSFRVPDILAASGARLREIGTTNRTRLSDYEKALSKKTGLILKVHTSNFRIVGFTEETRIDELAGLARRAEGGDLVDLKPLKIRDETPVSQVLEAGADIVTFSGDKLLGGPQAGFAVGRPELVTRLRKDPLARVCRLDRLLIAALHRTLAAYVRGVEFDEVPTLRMLAMTPAQIERRAKRLKREVVKRGVPGRLLQIVDGISRTGGGSSPTGERPTRLLSLSLPGGDAGPVESSLRSGDPPIVGRLQEGKLLLDLRTVLESQEDAVADRLALAIIKELG
jgi:L-seryl-tRNA(Ser) seleniumtransferase